MIDEIRDNAAAGGFSQRILAGNPITPQPTNDFFFVPVIGPIVRIRFRDRQPQGPFVVAKTPGTADELTRFAERTEPLIIVLIGNPKCGQRLPDTQDLLQRFFRQVSQDDMKPVGNDVLRSKWTIRLPLIGK